MAHQEEFTDLTATQLTGCQQAETNPEITLSTASPEQWIFAPIAVIIQQMSLKKPPSAPAPLKPETNLSFCLQANLGFMETPKQKWQVALSNMALIQTQAIVVSSIAVIPAALLGEKPFMLRDFFCLLLSAVATASFASLLLGLLMIGVVIMARKLKQYSDGYISNALQMNPDNITTPVAASLGDVSTLFILLGLGSVLLRVREHYCWALVLILLCFYVFAVASAYKASEDHFTLELSKVGCNRMIGRQVPGPSSTDLPWHGRDYGLANPAERRKENQRVKQQAYVGTQLIAIHAGFRALCSDPYYREQYPVKIQIHLFNVLSFTESNII
ncbi:divalent cation transporter [Teladorsagia circumcincta]|uniref:Divalent cation transporter n=1 Tax=Teladorsagia circumcincta TaxID=45464 RepID=A0A2G9U2B5_TELCI|nr:divalent cation transporter [Teladorsagia circumcincta]